MFFAPRRRVTMTVRHVRHDELPGLSREELNPFLEDWYNQDGPETPHFVPFHLFFGPRTFDYPAMAVRGKIDLSKIEPATMRAVNTIVEEKRPAVGRRSAAARVAAGGTGPGQPRPRRDRHDDRRPLRLPLRQGGRHAGATVGPGSGAVDRLGPGAAGGPAGLAGGGGQVRSDRGSGRDLGRGLRPPGAARSRRRGRRRHGLGRADLSPAAGGHAAFGPPHGAPAR